MKAVTQYLRGRGFDCVHDDFYSQIALWQKWYKGKVPAVHNYVQFNGLKKIRRTRKSLGMAKQVAEDWSDLLLNDKLMLTVNKATAQKRLDAVLEDNGFRVRANQLVELAFALGTGAFVEYMDEGQVKIDYVRAGMIYPIAWDNSRITQCAFASERVVKNEKIVYLNIHRLERGAYVIENRTFRRNGSVMTEIELPEGVLPEVRTGSAVPRFQIVRPNVANNIDLDAPLGISVYSGALDAIEHVDTVFDSYNNEFRLGKKRITVPVSMSKIQLTQEGIVEPMFDENDTEFFAIPTDDDADKKITEHDMKLRAAEHDTGMQTALNLVSWKCGMGTKRYVFRNGQLKTATEVVSDNSALQQSRKKHEILLENALVGLVEAIADLLKLGEVKVTVGFDDSVIEDTTTEKQTFLQEIREGIRQKWEYRARFFGETEEIAKSRVDASDGFQFA